MFHMLLHWHRPEYRLGYNYWGELERVCAKCWCPKDFSGYNCQHRVVKYNGVLQRECGYWEDETVSNSRLLC